MTNRVAVLGSINFDTTYRVDRMPQSGETVTAINKTAAPGGKGANQAVAAARSGARTSFIGMVGNDDIGRSLLQTLKENNVDTRNIQTKEQVGTGSAIVTLDNSGQNSIMVYGGANQALTPGAIKKKSVAKMIAKSDFLIAQFETPLDTTLAAFKLAHKKGVKTILNPAPAHQIDPELLACTDLIVPNDNESEAITGIPVANEAQLRQTYDYFRQHGVKRLVVTLGSKGAAIVTEKSFSILPAFKVQAVDTTAAGDTFIGALVSCLKPDFSNLEEATQYGQLASSLTVQGLGAMPSIPTLAQVQVAQAEVE